MKILFERGDKVLFIAAGDGQGNNIYEYGRVEAVVGSNVYLGNGIVTSMDNVLPCMESVRTMADTVKKAMNSGAGIYGHVENREAIA